MAGKRRGLVYGISFLVGLTLVILAVGGPRQFRFLIHPSRTWFSAYVVGPVALPNVVAGEQPLPSPGLLGRHYAPRTPLETASYETRPLSASKPPARVTNEPTIGTTAIPAPILE